MPRLVVATCRSVEFDGNSLNKLEPWNLGLPAYWWQHWIITMSKLLQIHQPKTWPKYFFQVSRYSKTPNNKIVENFISGINTWAKGVVRHSADIVDWTVEELASMDRKTRKILPINGCLHTTRKVARLYLPILYLSSIWK